MLASVALFLTYSFPAGSKCIYDFEVSLTGYIPVLGRAQNSAQVKMTIEVAGMGPVENSQGVTYDLTEFKGSLNGVALPFTIANIKAYFPKATLNISSTGRVVKTDVPDIQLPVRLPGLDAKRIPDITFLPIEFPSGDLEMGKPWSFKRSFSGSEATYTVIPFEIKDDLATFDVKLSQTSTFFEDKAGNGVRAEANAEKRIETVFTGTGKAIFDCKKNLMKSFTAESEAISQVTDLKSGEKSERRVKSKLKSELRGSQ